MYFSSDHFNIYISIFKYTLVFITQSVNKFVACFAVFMAEFTVVHMGENSFSYILQFDLKHNDQTD